MKIALAQTKTSKNLKSNFEEFKRLMQQASLEGAELVIFAETAAAFAPKNPQAASISMDNEYLQEFLALSQKLQIATVLGFYETQAHSNKPLNTVIFADCGQIIYKYSKTHLYDAFSFCESDYLRAASNPIRAFDTRFGRIGMLVCYELRFCEIARSLALDQAQLLIVPAAWVQGERKLEQFHIFCQARALENTVFLAACTQCGNIYTGGSCLVDPLGKKLLCLGDKPQLAICEIDLSARTSSLLPWQNQRRTELYLC